MKGNAVDLREDQQTDQLHNNRSASNAVVLTNGLFLIYEA